jgi:hypothetical protein
LLIASTIPSFSDTVTIRDIDPGGDISTYARWYQRWNESGDKLVIDGVCISACTLFLEYVGEKLSDRVCVTSRSLIGLHQASLDGRSDGVFTTIMVKLVYPQWVQKWIVDNGGLTPEIKLMTPEDMKGHVPLCPGETYSNIPNDKLIAKPEKPKVDVKTFEDGKRG